MLPLVWQKHWMVKLLPRKISLLSTFQCFLENPTFLNACFSLSQIPFFVLNFYNVYSEHCETSEVDILVSIINRLKVINYFYKTLHPSCLTEFWIHVCPSFCINYLKKLHLFLDPWDWSLLFVLFGKFPVKVQALHNDSVWTMKQND